jgi:hypothetical protein
MHKLLTLIVILFIAITLHAQRKSDIPAFGKVEKADLEMKECDFDNKAEAVVLFDAGELYCDISSSANMQLERHIRIKILKDKGLKHADIHIRYESYRNAEHIKNLSAQTYNLDPSGNIVTTKVEKKLIYDKPMDKYYSELVFTFPEAKAGSIIEYKFTQAWSGISLTNWYFQRSIPVKYSRYRVDFPNEIEVYSTPLCVLPFESKNDTKNTRILQTYSMRNIPALRDEPYISCDRDYLQRIEFRFLAITIPGRPRESLVKNWPDRIKQLMEDEDFGMQLKRNIPRTADLDEQLKNTTDPYRKMVTIHEYVRKNMEWNGYSNIWALNGVRTAWKDKKGTSGEINLILVNLLKDAGLKAHAVLVSTREHGAVSTAVADIRQFDKVLAYVEIGDKNYVLDATEKYTPAHLIPLEVMYSEGLVIEKPETFEWGWKPLWNETRLMKNVIVMKADINEAGVMKGSASLNSYDYARLQRIPDARKDKAKFLTKYFTTDNPGAVIDSLEFDNLDADSLPLVQKIKFSMPVNASGDYKYFSINLFSGLEKNLFVADNRFSDVFFGANQSYNIVANVTIPPGYEFETLPKSTRMIMPDTSISITRRLAAEGNQLAVRISLDFKKPFFTVQEYPDFKEFYKQLFALLSEQIAIKKKA